MSEFRRRLLMQNALNSGGLPSGYKQIEYLESDGVAYIDTGIVSNETHNYELEVLLPQVVEGVVFGGRISLINNALSLFIGAPTRFDRFNKQDSFEYVNYYDKKTHIISDNKGGFYLDNDLVINKTILPYNAEKTIYIFGLNNMSSGFSFPYNGMRLYNFNISNNEKEIMKLIPAIRQADSEAGMYDLVSGKFFTNANTDGKFIVPTT